MARKRQKVTRSNVDYASLLAQDGACWSSDVTTNFSASTLKSVKFMWSRWLEFCAELQLEPRATIAKITRKHLSLFIHWHINHSNIKKESSIWVLFRHFRQAYYIKTRNRMPTELVEHMQTVIVELNCTFTLSKIPKPKPVLGPDDLLVLLDHHWASCNDNYATERQRVQIAFLLLLVVYTTARPAAILETRRDTTKEDACSEEDSDFLKSKFAVDAIPDSLKYKDVKLFKIDDAEHPDEHIFIVVVTLRLMKGFRNNGSFPSYVLYERDDNLAFDPVLHLLALAFNDNAFLSEHIQQPEDLYGITVPSHLKALPIEWKKEVLEKPILRRAVESPCGKATSDTQALTYHQAQSHVRKLGKSAGCKDVFTLYAARRGAGEGIDRNATDAVRNRAMGHSRSDIYSRFYTNNIVNVDTISCFLRTPEESSRIHLASHMGLTRDPSAQSRILPPSKVDIDSHPDVEDVLKQHDLLKAQLTARHRTIRAAKLSPEHTDYTEIKKELRAARAKAERTINAQRWSTHFSTLGADEIIRQRTGSTDFIAQTATFAVEERRELSEMFCRVDDATQITVTAKKERRLYAMKLMISLCDRRVDHHRPAMMTEPIIQHETSFTALKNDMHQTPNQEAAQELVSDASTDTSAESKMYTMNRCPWCFFDESLPIGQRKHQFAQLATLRTHIENRHIRLINASTNFLLPNPWTGEAYEASGPFICPFQSCKARFITEETLKHHLAVEHEFLLAPVRGNQFDSALVGE